MEYLIGFIISILVVAIGIFVFKRGKYASAHYNLQFKIYHELKDILKIDKGY